MYFSVQKIRMVLCVYVYMTLLFIRHIVARMMIIVMIVGDVSDSHIPQKFIHEVMFACQVSQVASVAAAIVSCLVLNDGYGCFYFRIT